LALIAEERFFLPIACKTAVSSVSVCNYKEVNTDEWILLTDKATNIRMPEGTATDGLTIYTVNGSTIKHIAHQDIDGTYASVLSNLPKGVYIVRDKNGTRKVVKRNQ